MMELFLRLLAAHIIADFPLQPPALLRIKRTGPGIALHALAHITMMVLLTLPYLSGAWMATLVLILATHVGVDLLKLKLRAMGGPRWPLFWVDQAIHIGIIAAVSFA